MSGRVRCEKCGDALLDLSERQEVSAEGAREIFSRYPECSDELRHLISGFALAYELPLAEPPTQTDAPVLSLADARDSTKHLYKGARSSRDVSVLRVARAWNPPVATAAAALLMIAIGASLVTRSLRTGQQPIAEPSRSSPVIDPPRDLLPPEGIEARAGRSIETRAAGTRKRRREPRGQSRFARGSEGPQSPKPEKSESPLDAPSGQESGEEALPRLQGPREKNIPAFGGGASSAKAHAACRLRVAVFEKLLANQDGFSPSPSEQLDVGLCYAELGNDAEARNWLERASEHPETKARALGGLGRLDRSLSQ